MCSIDCNCVSNNPYKNNIDMKANEMPERIFIFDYSEAMVTPLEGDTVYVREDAFIEKACDYLKEHTLLSNLTIDDFRKAMEED